MPVFPDLGAGRVAGISLAESAEAVVQWSVRRCPIHSNPNQGDILALSVSKTACAEGRPLQPVGRFLLPVLALTLAAFIAWPTSPASGSIRPSPDLNAVLARADSLFLLREPDSALALLDPLLAQAVDRADPATRLRVLLVQARILGTIGRPGPSEEAARSALDLAWTLSDSAAACGALRWLAIAAGNQGQPTKSREYGQRLLDLALHVADREHEAHARLCLAFAELESGFPETARDEYERAILLFHTLGNLRFEAISRTGLGRCHYALGDWDRACRCYLAVVEETRRLGDPYALAHALNNLGGVEFLRGDPGRAVELYRSAYELQMDNGNPEGAVLPATNLALAAGCAGLHSEAVAMLEQVLAICEERGYRGHAALVVEQLGIVRRQQKRYSEAAALFRRGAACNPQIPPETRAHNLIGLAETLACMDSASAGLALLIENLDPLHSQLSLPLAVEANRLKGELLLTLARPREALAFFTQAETLASRMGIGFRAGPLARSGHCLALLGEADSALTVLWRAAEVWEKERVRSPDPAWRERLGIDARVLHTTLAECLLESPSASEQARARLMFDAMQKFKARTLWERMLGQEGRVPDSSLGARRAPVTVDELQRSVLKGGELLLDVFFGTRSVFLFAVNRMECRAVRLGQEADSLEKRLQRFRLLLGDSTSRAPHAEDLQFLAESSRLLSRLLLDPVADLVRSCDRILYSPDGPLNLIPFSALTLPEGERTDAVGLAGDPDFLLISHEVVRIPSATVLAQLRRTAPLPRPTRLAAILAVAAPSREGMSVLPGARAEVRWLARRYANVDQWTKGSYAADSSAAPASPLLDCDVLHVAGHTEIDDVCPWRSGILFSPGRAQGKEAYLRAREIALMRLPARLVVLSGCETAGGPIVSGEGVLGLTAAFSAAEVPAVMATLWPVDDEVTVRLVQRFYRALEKGKTAAAALKDAQTTVRGAAETRHPFFWAGFILVGDGEVSVRLARTAWFLRLPVLACLLASLCGALVYVRFHRRPRRREDGSFFE